MLTATLYHLLQIFRFENILCEQENIFYIMEEKVVIQRISP